MTQKKSAERKVKLVVKYPEDFYAKTGEFIDAVLTLDGDKEFPKDTEIKLTYKLNGNAYPGGEQTYKVQSTGVKKIFGHKLFTTPQQPRTQLNEHHINATEDYDITVIFPETATEDTYTFKVESALFADATTEAVTKSLGTTTAKVIGHELSKLTYTTTTAPINSATDNANKDKKEFAYKIEYPQFAMPDPKQFIDSIITLKDDVVFPQGTKIVLTFNDNPACAEYTVSEAGVKKLFGSLIAGQTTRSGLNSDLKGATQTFKLLITLPASATEAKYNLIIQTGVFATNDAKTDVTATRVIEPKYEVEITGYGH